MAKEPKISNQQLVIYNFNPCNAGTITNIFNIENQNLKFDPDAIRIEQISVAISNPNDNLYLLHSSLTDNNPIISFTGRTTFCVNFSEYILLRGSASQILFSISMLSPDATVAGKTATAAPTYPQNGGANPTNCYVSLSVNFLKLA